MKQKEFKVKKLNNFNKKEEWVFVMGKNRFWKNIWIILLTAIGGYLIVFNKEIKIFQISETFLFWVGVIVLLIAIIISLSKAYR